MSSEEKTGTPVPPWIWWVLLAIVAVLFTLSGCTRTEYVEKPVEVRIPVTEPCIDQVPEEPAYETQYLQADDPIGLVGQAYRIERKQFQSYVCSLFVEISGCMKAPPVIPSYCSTERNR